MHPALQHFNGSPFPSHFQACNHVNAVATFCKLVQTHSCRLTKHDYVPYLILHLTRVCRRKYVKDLWIGYLRRIECITEDVFLTLQLQSWELKLSANRNAKTGLAGLSGVSMSLCYCFWKTCLVQKLVLWHTCTCVRPGRSCFVRARSAWRSPRGSGNETATGCQMLYSHKNGKSYGLMLVETKVDPDCPNL